MSLQNGFISVEPNYFPYMASYEYYVSVNCAYMGMNTAVFGAKDKATTDSKIFVEHRNKVT